MKRRINLVLSLFFAVSTLLAPLASMDVSALAANQIDNPSVETPSSTDSSLPSGWLNGKWGTNSAAFTYDTTGHTGSRSVKVQMTSYTDGDAKWYFTPQAVTAGGKYTFSDYYKATTSTSLVAQFDNGAGSYSYVDLATVAAAPDWTQSAATFTVPSGMKNVTVFHLINAIGSLSIDDASLTPVVTSAPTVSISSPSTGATLSGTTTLAATANDANGIAGVQFQIDGANIGSETTNAPYQTSWNTASTTNGTHTVTAIARNTQGITATSAAVSVTVNNSVVVPPTSADLVPNNSVETPNPANTNRPQNWQTDKWGTNTSTFSYVTNDGQDGTRSVKVQTTAYTSGDAKWSFTPQAVTVGNKYTFTDYYKATRATEVVAQFDNGAGSYSYLELGTPVASATWKQFTGSFTVPAGMKNVTVFHLINGVGTLQTDTFSLIPAAAPSTPTVVMTAPSGAISGNNVQFAASASDANGIKNVQFKVDGTNVGNPVTTSPYGISWDSTTVGNGTHTVSATATNNSGVSTTSAAVSITVNNPASTNLIANPSVETISTSDPSSPQGWQSGKWGTNTTTFSYLSTGGHTGNRAVQTKTTSYTDGDAKWSFNPVAITQGTQYRFSDFYKATIATEVDAAFEMADGSTVYQIIGLPEASSTAWASFNTTFTVPKGAVNMTVYHLIHGQGTLTLDDANLQVYTPVGFNRALVTLTFDDGWATSYTQGLPLLKKYGFKSTQFIVTGLVNTPDYVTTAQVKAFSTAGHEIGSHTVTHTNMLTQTKAQYDNELSQSKTQLQQWTGQTVTSFAFPNGLYNNAIVTDAKALYTATRGVEAGLNSKDNFNAYDIKVQDVGYSTTTAQISDWIAQAQATKTWLVLVYHAVDPNDTSDYNVTPAHLDSQLAAIKNSGMPVVTMQQALAELKPQL